MADEASMSTIPSPPFPSISSPSSNHHTPSIPITANLFQITSTPPTIPTQRTTTSPHDNQPASQNGLPLVPIVGAAAGVFLILLAVGVWYFLRRRRQRRKDTKSGFSIVFPDNKGSSQYDHERHSRSRSRGGRSSNNTTTRDERTSVDSFPGHSFPGDQSSIHDDHDLEMALPLHCSTLPFPDSPYSRPRQPPIIPVNPRSQPPTGPARSISIDMSETPGKQAVEEVESAKHSHIHIDMVGTDLASLIPIVVIDEIKPAVVQSPPAKQAQVAQEHKPDVPPACTHPSSDPESATETEDTPRESTDTIILPVPVPRGPKVATQISTDSATQGGRTRISIAYPPPPPPTIPPPAIPSGGQEQGRVSNDLSNRSSVYSVSNHLAGRRPTNTRTSTESSRIPCFRRSVSMDAASFTPDGRRLSRKLIIPPPSMPPPPVPLPPPPPVHLPTPSSPSSTPVPSTSPPSRRRHQRSPIQTLNTSLFDSSDRSAISPPLSPLTIQIPRPSSRSFQSLLTINTQLTAENVQQYLQQQQPQPLEICKPDSPTDSIFAVSPRTSSLHHTPRSRSKSAAQLETQRIMILPSSPATPPFASLSFSPPVPPVPAMPSSLADHLPLSSPRSTSSQSYTSYKRPSLSHQQSSGSLDSARPDITTAVSVHGHHDYQHYERGAHSPEPKKRHDQKQHRRRSMSAPTSPSSSTPSPSSSSPSSSRHQRESSTSSSGRRRKEEGSTRAASVSPTSMSMNMSNSAKDQELQAIIADAIAIAAAKTAAVETARHNNNSFHQQLQTKQQQHQYQQFQNQRRVHPQMMDPWRSHTPSTAEFPRPGSPL